MARRLRSFRGQGCEQVMVGRVANQRAIEKGCDFGYALAANSCEGVTGVDACTVTALGSITAFAASEPRRSSRNAVGFFGSGRPAGRPAGLDHPAYFEPAIFSCQPFSAVDESDPKYSNFNCQRPRLVQMQFIFMCESFPLNHRYNGVSITRRGVIQTPFTCFSQRSCRISWSRTNQSWLLTNRPWCCILSDKELDA